MPEASIYAPSMREKLQDETIYHMKGDELITHVARERCEACAHDIRRALPDLMKQMEDLHDIPSDSQAADLIIEICADLNQNQISA